MKKTLVTLLAATTLAAAFVPAFATTNEVVGEYVEDTTVMTNTDVNGPGASNEAPGANTYVENIEKNELPVAHKPEVIGVEIKVDKDGKQVEVPVYSKAPARVEGPASGQAPAKEEKKEEAKKPAPAVAKTPTTTKKALPKTSAAK